MAVTPDDGAGAKRRTVKPDVSRTEPSLFPAATSSDSHPAPISLFESFLSRENLTRALRRVEANKGAPGPDGMRTTELRPWLHTHWPEVHARLDAGTYRPQPVRRVFIPKPGGKVRPLGVPTVLDRLIQQALLQALTPVFDRVNHDALMARLARKIDDKKVLKLLRAYLSAGVMQDGVKVPQEEGTPQGSPLSPLLANIMLDDLDKELEVRGHQFVRYADDIMIYVKSERAAERVMQSTRAFVEKRLKLRVNEAKSAVAPATACPFLGFGFFWREGGVKVRLDPKARAAVKMRLRRLTGRSWRVSMAERIAALNRFSRGWTAYYALADTPSVFAELDEWLRRRLRQVRWKEWKKRTGRFHGLVACGISVRQARTWAGSGRGCWRVSGSPILQRALPVSYWQELGLAGLIGPYRQLRDARRTAGCGPACPVVWEGPG